MNQLFREEAVQYAAQRLEGRVIIAVPLATSLLTGLVVVILVAGVTFLSIATYARKETVTGWLTPESGVLRATAVRGGIVDELFVSEGENLTVGAPIARIRLSTNLTAGDSSRALLDALSLQANAASQTVDAQIERLRGEHARLDNQIVGIDEELSTLEQQIDLQHQRVEIARNEAARAELIAERGYLSANALSDRQLTLLSAQQEMARLEASTLRLRAQRRDVLAQQRAIPIEIRSTEASALEASASHDQRTTSVEADSAYIVTATAPVRVAALPVRPGQSLAARETVAVLVPAGEQLIAELFVPSKAAGFILENQEVRLRYEAFPHQRFGTASGHIFSVSSTVLAPEEVRVPGLTLNEPVFRIRVALDRQSVDAYGQTMPLQPGLLLAAEIIIDRRSLFEWLFDPVFAAGR